ncbi:MAG: TIGR02186 family protein, partial [Nitrospirae bacterium]|nr:TIGR02186 family protein [Nitrospirota bacterium]
MDKKYFTIKNSLFRILAYIGFKVLVLLGLFMSPAEASAELTATANHDRIKIDFFYHGSSVSVRGISDPGTDLVIKITSPDGHQALKKKGKVAGFLWMNVGDLKFENVPNLYFVNSTRKIEDILSREEMDKYVLGYPSLEKHVEIAPVANDSEKDKWFGEFLKYKQDSNLYAVSGGSISVNEKDGKQNYYVLCNWPYQATPG